MIALPLVAEWILPTLAAAAIVLGLREPGAAGRFAGALWRWRWPVLVATRFLWPALVFWTLGSDIESDLAWRAKRSALFLAGQVPGVDYANNHGPLVPYLEGIGRWLVPGHPPVGTLLFFAAGDCVAVLAGARLAGRLRAGAEAWAGAWLLLTPALWHQVAIRGQDESLFAGMLAAGLWCAATRRDAWAGAFLALGLCATKLTFLPYAAALFLALGPRRWRAPAAFVLLAGAIYAAYALTGATLGSGAMVRRHEANFGAGIGIPDTIHRFFPAFPAGPALWGYAALTGLAVVAVPWLHRGAPVEERALRSVAAVHAASLLSMPFCVSPYFAQGIVPVLLLALLLPARPARTLLWCLPLLAWLCAMHWTKHPAFTMPMKPGMILFHGFLLFAAARVSAAGGGTAAAPPAGPPPGRAPAA